MVPPVKLLADYIQRTLDRGGNLVIPSFAVGRTQEMLYYIREIREKKLVTGHDGFPVYVDSPMANEATAIYLQCGHECFDEETRALVDAGINPIWSDGIRISVSSEDSKAINENPEPKVILSASGMCEAGRIRHHLKHNLWRKESTVLFVGYQAEGTLGRRLYDGEKHVKLFGEDIEVNCEIGFLPGKSGHADRDGLTAWLAGFEKKPKLVFVNHGEDAVTDAFAGYLETEHGYKAFAPYSGTVFDLAEGKFLVCPKGVPDKKTETASGAKASGLYQKLVAAGESLLSLIRASRGKPNQNAQTLPFGRGRASQKISLNRTKGGETHDEKKNAYKRVLLKLSAKRSPAMPERGWTSRSWPRSAALLRSAQSRALRSASLSAAAISGAA